MPFQNRADIYYLDDVDTLEVDTDDDVDTELEVDTLKRNMLNLASNKHLVIVEMHYLIKPSLQELLPYSLT